MSRPTRPARSGSLPRTRTAPEKSASERLPSHAPPLCKYLLNVLGEAWHTVIGRVKAGAANRHVRRCLCEIGPTASMTAGHGTASSSSSRVARDPSCVGRPHERHRLRRAQGGSANCLGRIERLPDEILNHNVTCLILHRGGGLVAAFSAAIVLFGIDGVFCGRAVPSASCVAGDRLRSSGTAGRVEAERVVDPPSRRMN